jgi:hypothetical protein
MNEELRELGRGLAIDAMNWIERVMIGDADYPSLRLSFGWWLDGLASRAFNFFMDGSEEELRMAIDQEIPFEYLNKRQRDFVRDYAYRGCEPDFTLLALPNGEAK